MPRPTHPPLTHQEVRALAPKGTPVDVRDGEMRGLILTVLPSGRKQFAMRYRFGGKQKRFVLGEYPAVSLASARKLARNAQTAVDAGQDPAGQRQAVKRAPADTVAALVDDYLKKHARKFKRSAAEDERMLKADVLPTWRERSVRGLTRRDVRALLDRVVDRGSPIAANRLLAVVRKMLNFAVDQDWLDANPAGHVEKPAREISRTRVLTDDEIRRVWRILERFPTTAERPAPGRKRAKGPEKDPICPVTPALAATLKIRLVTGQRGGEVIQMRWSDLDLPDGKPDGWWTIPATDTKNGEAHRVPIVASARKIIEAQTRRKDSPFVFINQGASLRDRAKKAPALIARALGAGFVDFRGHDLRRTAATRMAAAGISRDHIGKVLNHVEGGARATRVYDRHSYDAEKRMALGAWDRTLSAILTAKPNTDANVVSIRTRRAR